MDQGDWEGGEGEGDLGFSSLSLGDQWSQVTLALRELWDGELLVLKPGKFQLTGMSNHPGGAEEGGHQEPEKQEGSQEKYGSQALETMQVISLDSWHPDT
jgi:hypothetical protein